MDTPTSTDDKSFAAVESALESEINNFVKQAISPNHAPPQIENNFVKQTSSPTLAPQIENNAARITSSVARLTSNSIQELEGLKSELQKLQEFLNSEVGRVQQEIESALAGIAIIVETIAPWKNTTVSVTPPNIAHAVRGPSPANPSSNRI
jgi:hypothetical protein